MTLNWNTHIRFLLAMLLVGACLNVCIPWKVLKENVSTFTMENCDDDQDQKTDDDESRDAKDERDERDEREKGGMEKDYLPAHMAMRLDFRGTQQWSTSIDQTLRHLVLETLVPPPRLLG